MTSEDNYFVCFKLVEYVFNHYIVFHSTQKFRDFSGHPWFDGVQLDFVHIHLVKKKDVKTTSRNNQPHMLATFFVTLSANLIDLRSFFSLSLNLLSCSVDVPYNKFQIRKFQFNNNFRTTVNRCSLIVRNQKKVKVSR